VAKRASVTLISLTDKTAAPEGMESGFSFRWHLELMTRELREEYFNKIIDRFEHLTQQSVKK
jgi:phytoene desaturase